MSHVVTFREPSMARFFFNDTRTAWLWLVVRLYVGWIWLEAGWAKVQSDSWVGPTAGAALRGFVSGALKKTGGAHPDVQWCYASFLDGFVSQHLVLFSNVVAYGEVIVGSALLLGLFTGLAAFFGIFMNTNYLLAGTVSVNPILVFLQLFLILAWRVSGWIGLDRYALRWLGTSWSPGKWFRLSKIV